MTEFTGNGMTFGRGLRDAPPDGSGDPCAADSCPACYDKNDHACDGAECSYCGAVFCAACVDAAMVRGESSTGRVCMACAEREEMFSQ